jgi:hypothetical protein
MTRVRLWRALREHLARLWANEAGVWRGGGTGPSSSGDGRSQGQASTPPSLPIARSAESPLNAPPFTFNDIRQAIINGLDSAQSEATGWDAVVTATLPVTAVVRTSDTVVTITLPAEAAYNITATETITATIPAAALVGAMLLVATPAFTVAPSGNVTVGLTGQAITSATGTLGRTTAKALAGTGLTSTPGTLGSTRTVGLTGLAIAVTKGTLAPPAVPVNVVLLEMELAGRGNGWTAITADCLAAAGITWERGLPGSGVADCLADSGTLQFTLNNSAANSAHLVGYYSPDSANCRSGFQLLAGVRVRILVGAMSYTRFTGYLEAIDPAPGIYRSRAVRCEAVGWMALAGRTRLGDLPILLAATGDDVFQTIIDSLPHFAQPRAIEKDLSADVYPYILDRIRDEQTTARDELYRLALSGIDRIWERGDGTIVYESRTRRSKATTNADMYTDAEGERNAAFSASQATDSIANSTQTTVHPRLPSPVTNAVLFSLNQPVQLAVGQSMAILGPWTDPDNSDVRVGAVSLVSLVAGTDYVANSAQDGSGADLTSALTVTVGLSGNATLFTVALGGSTSGWLTKLQQRGQALLDYGAVQATQVDQDSVDRFGLNPLNVDLPYQADPNFGIELAQYIMFTRSLATTRLDGFTRLVGWRNTTELTRSLGREVSDRIALTETVTGVAKSFFIDRIRESIFPSHINTQFSLSVPIDDRQFWQLEVVGRSELDATTRLGFGLIIGHVDVAHADAHGDVAFVDVAHSDSHTDSHADQAHGDGSSHGDSAHSDVAHGDVSHSDVTHQDAHADSPHQDTPHTDSHSDFAHFDSHVDQHDDHTDGATHFDLDQHWHNDGAHGDGHNDVAFVDEAAENAHGDVAHADVNHADVAHSDIAHNDGTTHSDVAHADVAHGDMAHGDVSHADTVHTDTHSDTAHGDAN